MPSTSSVPPLLSGLWGEALAVMRLREAGFDVDWQGGLTVGKDLVASRDGHSWYVQVKATTRSHGWIAWSGNGDRARLLDETARDRGATGAFFVLVKIVEPGHAGFNLDEGVLSIRTPAEYDIVGVTAIEFADEVDSAREWYSSQPRKRAGRNGEKVGDLLPADGLRYPIETSDYPDLSDFVKTLP